MDDVHALCAGDSEASVLRARRSLLHGSALGILLDLLSSVCDIRPLQRPSHTVVTNTLSYLSARAAHWTSACRELFHALAAALSSRLPVPACLLGCLVRDGGAAACAVSCNGVCDFCSGAQHIPGQGTVGKATQARPESRIWSGLWWLC